jgi:pyrroloquinoline quinone (PQQ) biosynthesis protein C
MNDFATTAVEHLRTEIEPLRQKLLSHPLYRDMRSPEALRIFMQYHVFAVWDFMSLLKGLQQQLCCVSVPWLPPRGKLGTRLVNEIVLGEESDKDERGGYASHFDLYRQSMEEFEADGSLIDTFLNSLRAGKTVEEAFTSAQVPSSVQAFVRQTFEYLQTGDVAVICCVFTYGREDLLPDVFQKIVDELHNQSGNQLSRFQFYLERHIELDKGEHGPMTTQLMIELCGNDPAKWKTAEQAAISSLEARLKLWNGIHQTILAEASLTA